MESASAAHAAATTVEALLVVGGVVLAALVVGGMIRAVRLYRRLRLHTVTLVSRARRGDVVAAVSDPVWWGNQRDRRRLWRSVAAAERAVAAATGAGIPTGDLASVTRQLRTAAFTVDAGLASAAASRQRAAGLQQQAAELAATADDIARAATAAIAADGAPQTARVLEAARLELAALRHAWTATGALTPARRS